MRRHTPPSLRVTGLILGPLLFAVTLAGPTPDGMSSEAQATAALATWMAIWWLTRAFALHITALLPLALLPLLGVRDFEPTASAYRSGVIFLFLGGFILAIGVQKWGLHRRLAHAVSPRAPRGGHIVLLSFMGVTAFLSMWMSNTAAAMVMLPVAAEVVHRIEGHTASNRVGTAFMLGVAYAASVGGIATIIGSPPNAILTGYVSQALGETISFLDWMIWGLPVAILAVIAVWLFLTRVAYREISTITIARGESIDSGRMEAPASRTLIIFSAVVILWLARGIVTPLADTGLADEDIAIAGAALLFLLPAAGIRGPRLLHLPDLKTLPWGILILFGGGIALAGAIDSSGLAIWLGQQLTRLGDLPTPLILLAFIVVTILLTELASNTATAAVLVAVAHGSAAATGLIPIQIMVAVTLAASCAFMLPVATPPNAVVFSSGRVTLGQMIRAGLALNVIMAALIAIAVTLWLPLAWPHHLP